MQHTPRGEPSADGVPHTEGDVLHGLQRTPESACMLMLALCKVPYIRAEQVEVLPRDAKVQSFGTFSLMYQFS